MIKYCYERWDKNKDKLEAALRETDLSDVGYADLLALVVKHILNETPHETFYAGLDADNIHCIDDGDYQGTLLFLIPEKTYQPSEHGYLMTYIGYGSCSCCDYLQSIQPWDKSEITNETIKKFMSLCKDFITNMVKPYNHGWRQSDDFEHISMEVIE